MEKALKTLVTTFLSSGKGKDLDSGSFKKLVKSQFGGIMEDSTKSSAIKEMQQGLDENNDGKVSFQEYMVLIGNIAKSFSQQMSETNTDAS